MNKRNRKYLLAGIRDQHLSMQRLTKGNPIQHADFRAKRTLGSKDLYKMVTAECLRLFALKEEAGKLLDKLEDKYPESDKYNLALPIYNDICKAHLMWDSLTLSLHISRDRLGEDYHGGLLYHQIQ